MKRALKFLALVVALIVVAAGATVAFIETSCTVRQTAPIDLAPPVFDAVHRRPLVDTLLTYPEWSIVHAYEDLATVTRAESESSFGYASSIGQYWTSLCRIYAFATARGQISTDMRVMLHVIGLSFTAEMAVKGIWEKTIGQVTVWLRGSTPTAEDRFAADIADAYAQFLRQTPWYEFPFGETLARFWRDTPFSLSARSVERRLALSLEWGVKAVYARLIGLAAGLTPAVTTNRTLVSALDDQDIQADPRIAVVARRPDGSVIIETPRYRVFTGIVRGLAMRGREIIEIAGNREIFITLLAPTAGAVTFLGQPLMTVPLQGRPGMTRQGYLVPVDSLANHLRRLEASGLTLEHIYDY